METQFERDVKELPERHLARIRFEDLETDPIAEIERIYASLNLRMTKRFRQRMQRYLESISSYQKNRFQKSRKELSGDIRSKLDALCVRNGYPTQA